ncbi:fatty acid desaturase [Pseudonocardia tropica]|uniref:Fatty acid desaturase n=1 Tax=Pseudonocardia tropica TaxID=681289 RepID=A0ABV1K3H4_9PSEU
MTDAAAPSRNKVISNPYIHRLQRRHFLLFDIAPIIGTVAALALLPVLPFGATEIALLAGMWLVSGLGITVGYHRLFTHRTFRATPFAESMLAITGSMAGQGGVVSWVAIHRRHHEFSDRDGDPHSPNLSGDGLRGVLRGLVHSHFLWMRRHEYPNIAHYAPDLLRNRRLVNVSRHYYWWFALGVAVPTVVGGLVHLSWQGALAGLLWGGFVRVFLLEHIIWAINSFLHRWGSKPYESRENSRNGAVFSLLTFGESWHNNHHAFPSSPNFGLQWYRPDPGYWLIRGLSAVGLVSDLKNPAAEQIAAKRIRTDERKAAA